MKLSYKTGGFRMNKVAIICDSTADLTPEMYKQHDVEVVPLGIAFGEEAFKDGIDINAEQLYKKVEETGVLPATSATSPGVLEEVFRRHLDAGEDVIYTGIGSKISSNFQNAHIAKAAIDGADDRIFLLDSDNLSSATGLLVLKMCKYRDEGKSAKEIFDLVQPLSAKLSAKFVVDKLDYLHKGGRCSGATKLFGHLFHIHPVIKVVDGKMIVYKKPHGKLKAGIDEQINELKEDLPNIDMDNIMITDSGVSESDRQYFYDEVAKLVDPSIIRLTRAGCIVSSHCGPGTIGVLYILK